MATAVIVVDLGFGDAGKGTMTDWLVRRLGAGLVVRFNGGAQAGHSVVTSAGRHHTFAQLGAGSFVAGVRTHLSRFMVVHPTGLLVEAAALARQGVRDGLERVSISPQARIITPFQQAANRLREVQRDADRHGSCGIGVGETVQDSLEHPSDSIVAGELGDPATLRRKLASLQARKWSEFSRDRSRLAQHPLGATELAVLESSDAGERWIEAVGGLVARVPIVDEPLPRGPVVFEGAQGVLLDEWRGFHPYTTWSTCTFANALELLESWEGRVVRLGVLRSYATRHGAGPFPTEDRQLHIDEPHNAHGPWQGAFRLGWPDAVLGRYAIAACGGVDAVALTHLDRVPRDLRLATSYRGGELALGPHRDLDYQTRLTESLLAADPVYQDVPTGELPATLESELGAPIGVESFGPRAEDKRETGHLNFL